MNLKAALTISTNHTDYKTPNEPSTVTASLELDFYKDDYSTSDAMFDDMKKLISMFVGEIDSM
jgi:hypothetical protein